MLVFMNFHIYLSFQTVGNIIYNILPVIPTLLQNVFSNTASGNSDQSVTVIRHIFTKKDTEIIVLYIAPFYMKQVTRVL